MSINLLINQLFPVFVTNVDPVKTMDIVKIWFCNFFSLINKHVDAMGSYK